MKTDQQISFDFDSFGLSESLRDNNSDQWNDQEWDSEAADADGASEDDNSENKEEDTDVFDWENFDDDLQDFEDAPIREELSIEVQTDGSVERDSRAFQEATHLGLKYGWVEGEIVILAIVFEKYGWGPTKRALDREMHFGLSARELQNAFLLREVWESYPEFSTASGWYTYPTLSWPFALNIIRSFPFEPSPEEVEAFLIHSFNYWKHKSTLKSGVSRFIVFLNSVLQNPRISELCSPEVLLQLVQQEDDGSLSVELDPFIKPRWRNW